MPRFPEPYSGDESTLVIYIDEGIAPGSTIAPPGASELMSPPSSTDCLRLNLRHFRHHFLSDALVPISGVLDDDLEDARAGGLLVGRMTNAQSDLHLPQLRLKDGPDRDLFRIEDCRSSSAFGHVKYANVNEPRG